MSEMKIEEKIIDESTVDTILKKKIQYNKEVFERLAEV
jgi:hypothetical protein